MHRIGDRLHELFQASIKAHRPLAGLERDGTTVAIDILIADGHDVAGIGSADPAITPNPAFDRLEMLAWRMIDREQDNFALALGTNDRDAAIVSVDMASCFLDLLDAVRVQPLASGSSR